MSEGRLLTVSELSVTFRSRRSKPLQAVRGISLTLDAGETLGIVGESGSGKSTAVRAILQLVTPDPGSSVEFKGQELTRLAPRVLRRRRREMQMIFQDPYASLDPQWTVGASVTEPLRIHKIGSTESRRERAAELLRLVDLDPGSIDRYPSQFSGGQRQRIAVARAVALEPALVACDEPVSALDVSTQNRIVELLRDIQRRMSVAYLFISHDLNTVRRLADRVAVVYLGQIVESGSTVQIFNNPRHPYTRALLSAIPIPNPKKQRTRQQIILRGDAPDPRNPPSGCAFRTRCPHAKDLCAVDVPKLRPYQRSGSDSLASVGLVACHFAEELPLFEDPAIALGEGRTND